MKNQFQFLSIFILFFCSSIQAQIAPSIEWEKSFGGVYDEVATSIQQTIDKGFIVAGRTISSDGDVSGSHGNYECWIVKLDSTGNLIWQKCLGGSSGDYGYSIQQTADSGYVIAGSSSSSDGDVSGNHGEVDFWIVKLDLAGAIQWQTSLGGSDFEEAHSIQQTIDGGYIISGYTASNDGDVSGWHIGYEPDSSLAQDYWIVKLDVSGNLVWQKCLGGSRDDVAQSIQQTTDGGYIVAGWSYSNDGDVSGNHGYNDYWIVKLDSTGTMQWSKSLGGAYEDYAFSIQQISHEGFIIAGGSSSNGGDVSGNHGMYDYWIVKLDTLGNLLWQKCLGGGASEEARSVEQTTDGGFIVAGESASNDGDASGNHSGVLWADYWVVELDSLGNLIWQKCMGGTKVDDAFAAQQTIDNGFIVAGTSRSNDGDVSGNHLDIWSNTTYDYWIVKLTSDVSTAIPYSSNNSLHIFPNPTSTTIQINLPSTQPTTLTLFNLLGEKIKQEKVTGKEVTLDVSELPAGIYVVRSNETLIGKFVKE